MTITLVSHICKIFVKVLQLHHTSGTQFNVNETHTMHPFVHDGAKGLIF